LEENRSDGNGKYWCERIHDARQGTVHLGLSKGKAKRRNKSPEKPRQNDGYDHVSGYFSVGLKCQWEHDGTGTYDPDQSQMIGIDRFKSLFHQDKGTTPYEAKKKIQYPFHGIGFY
jgi:hypothetical protein